MKNNQEKPEIIKVQREILVSLVESSKIIKEEEELVIEEDKFLKLLEDSVVCLLNSKCFLE